MKKILSLFAFAAIVLTFAACGGNDPEADGFSIQMNTLTAGQASFTITPVDQEADYFWLVYPKRYRGKLTDEEYVDIQMSFWANPEAPWPYDRSILGRKGAITVSEMDLLKVVTIDLNALCPNCDHVIAVCKIGENKQRVGDLTILPFKTLMPEGFVDMGLPSGRLWNSSYVLENGTPRYYSLPEAWDKTYELPSYVWIPYVSTWRELRDGCSWEWSNDLSAVNNDASYKDVRGYVLTSKTNSNRLCLPAAGGIEPGKSTPAGGGLYGVYWTADETTEENAYLVLLWSPLWENTYEEKELSQQNKISLCFCCPNDEEYYY